MRRDDPDSRVRASEEIQRRAASGGKWARVLIFPEGDSHNRRIDTFEDCYYFSSLGTTHNRQVVLQFKKGPFRPKVPIQIMLLKYKHRLVSQCFYILNKMHEHSNYVFSPIL